MDEKRLAEIEDALADSPGPEIDELVAEVRALQAEVRHWIERFDHLNRTALAAITMAKAEARRAMRARCVSLLMSEHEDATAQGEHLEYRKALLDSAASLRALPDEP